VAGGTGSATKQRVDDRMVLSSDQRLAVKSKSHTTILCMPKRNLGMDDIQLVLVIRTEAVNEVNH
jgi:hypothetical protein